MDEVSSPIGKSVEASLLLDFYGSLLSERSLRLMDQHFNEDLSYGEIAELSGVTRQAVHDGVSKGLAQLTEYEARLGMIRRFRIQRESIEKAVCLIQDGREEEASAELKRMLEDL
jgi:predicted DNA-binding protein YlxM (UPF0122 family)